MQFSSSPTNKAAKRIISRNISHLVPVGLQSPEKSMKVFKQGKSQKAWQLPGVQQLALREPWELPSKSLPLLYVGTTGVKGLCFLLEICCGEDYLCPV